MNLLAKGFKYVAILIFVFLSLLLIRNTVPYFNGKTDFIFLQSKQDLLNNWIWRASFYMHIAGSIICLATGIFQFSNKILKKNKSIHKFLGKTYVLSVLLLAWPGGQFMSVFANGGLWGKIPFFILSILWAYSTYRGYISIRKKNVVTHSAWMIRSYSYAATAVTFRTYFILLKYFLSIDPLISSIAGQWMSLVGNIIAAELIINYYTPAYLKDNTITP